MLKEGLLVLKEDIGAEGRCWSGRKVGLRPEDGAAATGDRRYPAWLLRRALWNCKGRGIIPISNP